MSQMEILQALEHRRCATCFRHYCVEVNDHGRTTHNSACPYCAYSNAQLREQQIGAMQHTHRLQVQGLREKVARLKRPAVVRSPHAEDAPAVRRKG